MIRETTNKPWLPWQVLAIEVTAWARTLVRYDTHSTLKVSAGSNGCEQEEHENRNEEGKDEGIPQGTITRLTAEITE